jgi:hypothetical protein
MRTDAGRGGVAEETESSRRALAPGPQPAQGAPFALQRPVEQPPYPALAGPANAWLGRCLGTSPRSGMGLPALGSPILQGNSYCDWVSVTA